MTCPLVEMADMDTADSQVTKLQRVMTIRPCQMPACPTTQVSLRKSMVPQMLRRHLINTPSIHPNFITCEILLFEFQSIFDVLRGESYMKMP